MPCCLWLRAIGVVGPAPSGRALGICAIPPAPPPRDRKSTRLNSSHMSISYAVFCLKKKNQLSVGVGALERGDRYLCQQADRVLAAQLSAARVDRAQRLGGAGRPRPTKVVAGVGERAQRLGHARGERLGGCVDVLDSERHGRG